MAVRASFFEKIILALTLTETIPFIPHYPEVDFLLVDPWLYLMRIEHPVCADWGIYGTIVSFLDL